MAEVSNDYKKIINAVNFMEKEGQVTSSQVISHLGLESFLSFQRLMGGLSGCGVVVKTTKRGGETFYKLESRASDSQIRYVLERNALIPKAEQKAQRLAKKFGGDWKKYFSSIMDDMACHRLGTLTMGQAMDGRERFSDGYCHG